MVAKKDYKKTSITLTKKHTYSNKWRNKGEQKMVAITIRNLQTMGAHQQARTLAPVGNPYLDAINFAIWKRWVWPKFFGYRDAPMHGDMDFDSMEMYANDGGEYGWIGARENSKTTEAKFVVAYGIAYKLFNYAQVLARAKASQFTTDVYNMLLEPRFVAMHGDQFKRKTLDKTKRSETMSTFVTKNGIKVQSGSVLTSMRGSVEQENRPDFIIFDDIENEQSLNSPAETEKIWRFMQEALSGMNQARRKVLYLGNYLSEAGNIHKVVKSKNIKVRIQPIIKGTEILWPDKYRLYDEEVARINVNRPEWRKLISIQTLRANTPHFEQEYLCEPAKFGDAYFNAEHVKKCYRPRDPIVSDSGLRVYEQLVKGGKYAIGSDTSEGIGRDANTADVMRFTPEVAKIIACYDNADIPPDDFATLLASWGKYYNKALLAPERNNTGHAVVAILKQMYYDEHIYRMHNLETGEETSKYGWVTTAPSLLHALGEFKLALANGYIEFYDDKLFNELITFTKRDVVSSGKDTTRHFDLLMGAVIAWQMRHSVQSGEIYIT